MTVFFKSVSHQLYGTADSHFRTRLSGIAYNVCLFLFNKFTDIGCYIYGVSPIKEYARAYLGGSLFCP